MNESQTCPQEPLVLAANGSAMNAALSLHLQDCSSCQEALALAAQMGDLVRRPIATPPPDPDVIWMMARLSKTRTPWTSETFKGVAALISSALLSLWAWPAITAYVSGLVPNSAMTMILFLTSCVIAGAIAAVAAKTMRLLTGD